MRFASVGTSPRRPHTMTRMGDVLAGFHAAWEFESDSVLIRFERGIRTPKLFQALGERRIPLELSAKETEGRLMGDFGASSVPIGIEIAPDGKRAYVAHANADQISIVDLESWKRIGALTAGKEPDGMGYSTQDVKK